VPNNEYKNELELLQDYTNEDISNISINIFNKEHFDSKGEELSEGKR